MGLVIVGLTKINKLGKERSLFCLLFHQLLLAVTLNTVQRQALAMRSKDSDSRSQTSSQRNTFEDLAPEDSASQCESSMSRASRAARRAAAEVRSRVAQQKAAKELQIAALQQEVAVLDAEGEKDALDTGDEVFDQVLSNTDAPSRRSAPESKRVKHWAPEGHMRRVQVEETRTSCMVVCGPSGGSVDRGSSVQSPLIPRRLFRDGEGDSQTMVAERSRIAPLR